MEEFYVLILVAFFVINSRDKAESVQLEELEDLPLQTFDELFVEEWWDKDEAEDLKTPPSTNFGQNAHHQIDRQNTLIGQIEPNSTDQNPPLTESDHSDNATNGEEQNERMLASNENITEDERKRKIIDKFLAIKEGFKQKGKFSKKERTKIEDKIAQHLKVSRTKIYEWKKDFGLSQKFYEKNERKNLIEKFDQRKAELKWDGFKISYQNELDKTVAKELGLSFVTIYNWKRELGQTTPYKHKLLKRYYEIKDTNPNINDGDIAKMLKICRTTLFNWKKQFKRQQLGQPAPNKYSHNEQKELMKHYYEIKGNNPKITDEKIAKILKIRRDTLNRWKRQFKRQQFHQNSVDGHAGSNFQEIGHSESI